MRGQPSPSTDSPAGSADERFEDAYRSSGTAVLGYALRRSLSREDALDVVAETFATAWRRRTDMPADPLEVRPWLFGIARRCLANAARGARRSGRLGERLAASLTDAALPDPSTLHEHRAEARRVREALDELSADDRELVTLVAWEGLTPSEAAAALGLAPGTARVRLHRARTRLRAVLSTTEHVEETVRDH
jgi:RNA polymerase sigma-70 factor (ECF subfamily)